MTNLLGLYRERPKVPPIDWPRVVSALGQYGWILTASGRKKIESIGSSEWLTEALVMQRGDGGIADQKIIESWWNQHHADSSKQKPVKNLPSNGYGRVLAPFSDAPVPSPQPPLLGDHRLADFPTHASDVDIDLTIHYDITGRSRTEGKLHNIRSLFTSRIERIRKMIRRTGDLESRPISVHELWDNAGKYSQPDQRAVIVGIVQNVRTTKNGHLMFELEDESSSVNCIIYKRDQDPNDIVHVGLMNDDVIGLRGGFNRKRDLFQADEPYFPPLPRKKKKRSEVGISVAFLSDIHVGSKTFLEQQWHKMTEWFRTDPLARTIKYLILSGDVVDGVGVYPGQDRELNIPDLFNQYDHLARLLEDMPDWVEVMILPGNHDAVRPQEPQPALDPDIQQSFNSTTFVGNPCDFSLHGLRLLSYHGKSIDDFVGRLRNVDYGCPVEAMREMLRRRHLAPTWGGKTPLSPEPEDDLVIRDVPDIFVTGHVHGHHCEPHKGTTLICSSTWQDQTDYQRTLGFQPKPCILTIVNLGTRATTSIPFA